MYIQELKKRIAALESKIQKRNDLISSLINKNNDEILKLEKYKLRLEEKVSEERLRIAKTNPKSPKTGKRKSYQTLDTCESVGLYNKIVLFPVAKCVLHNCYLDYSDVRKRGCVMRMCKHMKWVEDREI